MATHFQFDKYYNNFPKTSKEIDFKSFWSTAVNQVRSVSMQSETKLNAKASSSKFNVYDIKFRSYQKILIYGRLYIPKKKKKTNPIIFCNDYNTPNIYKKYKLPEDFSYLFLTLRGHHTLNFTIEEDEKNEKLTPNFLIENIYEPKHYYLTGLYLDIVRSIDFLRLNKNIDCSSISIIAKGISVSAALLAQSFNKRIKCLVLDSPNFVDLETSQNKSLSDATNEINKFISSLKRDRAKIKSNLSYYDGVNFADKVDIPILMVVGLRDHLSCPKASFGLFHHFNCDKTIEIYPDDGNECGGPKQFTKSLKWIKNHLKN